MILIDRHYDSRQHIMTFCTVGPIKISRAIPVMDLFHAKDIDDLIRSIEVEIEQAYLREVSSYEVR